MPIVKVDFRSSSELQEIADALGRSRKVVVLTGAGISTSCGIPDFRSKDGLYSLIQNQYNTALKNPPWKQSNTFDINNRPKKKRKNWYYEVVNPDGLVVNVIDDDLPDIQPQDPNSCDSSCSGSTDTSKQRTTSISTSPSSSIHHESDGTNTSKASLAKFHDQFDEVTSHVHQYSVTQPHSNSELEEQQLFSNLTENVDSEPLSSPPTFTSSLGRMKENLFKHQPCLATISKNSHESIKLESIDKNSLPEEKKADDVSSCFENTILFSSQSTHPVQRTSPYLKGRDLFDAMIWSDPMKTSIFYMFITSFREKVKLVQSTSEAHRFFKILRDSGRLVRNYTQNIDCLEEKEGFSTDLTLGPGNRARFRARNQKSPFIDKPTSQSDHFRGVEAVLLHGSLGALRCVVCSQLCDWDKDGRVAITSSGTAPECPHCTANNSKRRVRGLRTLTVGHLRPNVVLYGEEHPNSSLISPLITHDLKIGPDMLLVMGTSLKVHGLKVIIKEFAKAVHSGGGKVIFVNQTRPPESIWSDVIDYWVDWECDKWVIDLKERNKELWLPQGVANAKATKRKLGAKTGSQKQELEGAKLKTVYDDKSSAAYFVSKIMSSLAQQVSSSSHEEGISIFNRRTFKS